jgi:penicillin-binding protein 2
VIGYVGRVDVADLEAMGDSRNAALTHIGKAGIERFYEDRLRGEIGYEEVETNVEGRALGVLRRHDAKPGNDLTLTVDARLQQAMVDAFEGQQGAAIAIDPKTGEILGMVSLPSYDPNLFINGIGHKDWQALQAPARPLFNRNVLGGVPPGSTIKPFMALAALEAGIRTPQYETLSTGEFFLPGQARGYRDWRPGGHGRVNLRESLAQSVNSYYFELAVELGVDRLDQYFDRLGFGHPTGIDLSGEIPGTGSRATPSTPPSARVTGSPRRCRWPRPPACSPTAACGTARTCSRPPRPASMRRWCPSRSRRACRW